MRRELTSVERDALRLIRGGGPYPELSVIIAVGNACGSIVDAKRAVDKLKREGIILPAPDGTIDTSWTMEEILQGWKEC